MGHGIWHTDACSSAGPDVRRRWATASAPSPLGLGGGAGFTFSVSHAWLATFGFFFLRWAGLFPQRGLRFLEDARERGVLRIVGSVYQFRHARLQDQLATTRAGLPDESVIPGDSVNLPLSVAHGTLRRSFRSSR
jgi:hypothetical protein